METSPKETKPKKTCIICSEPTLREQALVGPICKKCWALDDVKQKYRYITKTRIKTEFKLKEKDFMHLPCHEVNNPHYRSASMMQLFLLVDVESLAKSKGIIPQTHVTK